MLNSVKWLLEQPAVYWLHVALSLMFWAVAALGGVATGQRLPLWLLTGGAGGLLLLPGIACWLVRKGWVISAQPFLHQPLLCPETPYGHFEAAETALKSAFTARAKAKEAHQRLQEQRLMLQQSWQTLMVLQLLALLLTLLATFYFPEVGFG